MSVEKISQTAPTGAGNARGVGGTKSAHGTQGAGDSRGPFDGFGALLSSLGADDAEPVVETTAVTTPPDDQSVVDANTTGNPIGHFAVTIEVPVLLNKTGYVDGLESSPDPNVVIQEKGALSSEGSRLTDADVLARGVSAGTKTVSRPIERSDLSAVPGAAGLGNVGVKAAKPQRELGRAENATVTAPITTAAVAGDPGKFELRVVGEKAEVIWRTLAQSSIEVHPLAAGQQAEVLRERAIFKGSSTTVGSDVGVGNGLDLRPVSLSLEGMASDVGGGMAQGEQSPGTYWMSSDMKSAEMKLDGFGETPVEVSITVHGNQTHVAFRTDEIQTRLALEDAGATLKEMLSKEGLDLTGVSVGTSGAGGDRAQDHRPKQERRLARMENLANKFPSVTSGEIGSIRVGQLDVFV